MSVERWGPYCPLPQQPGYVEVVYPMAARGLILDENDQVREMTRAELEESPLSVAFERALRNSFALKR